MDNITHSLVGVALARVGLRERVPFGTLTLVALANLPDADIVSGAWGTLYYFAYHRGSSHSIIGTAGLAAICSVLLWAIARIKSPPGGHSFTGILGAVSATLATHPLLDYTNSYGLRPFLPFLDRWYYGDLVYIIDPFLWLIVGGGVYLSSTRRRRTDVAWLASAVLVFGVTVLVSRQEPGLWYLPWFWALGVAAIWWTGRRAGIERRVWGWASLAGVVVWWTVLLLSRTVTLSEVSPVVDSRFGVQEQIVAVPRAAAPHQWDIFWSDRENVYYAPWSLAGALTKGFEVMKKNTENPAVQRALHSCPGALLANFARFEFFEVIERKGEPVVILRDARFVRSGDDGRNFGVFEIPVGRKTSEPCPGD